MDLTLHTDGGSRNNPGEAAIAYIIRNKGKEIYANHRAIGIATNNVAEYTALIDGLDYIYTYIQNNEVKSISVFSDSQLMVRQMLGNYKIKDATIKILAAKAKSVIQKIDKPVNFTHILREKNSETDALVKKSLFP